MQPTPSLYILFLLPSLSPLNPPSPCLLKNLPLPSSPLPTLPSRSLPSPLLLPFTSLPFPLPHYSLPFPLPHYSLPLSTIPPPLLPFTLSFTL